MRKRVLGVTILLLLSGISIYVWLGIVIDKGVEAKADGTNAYAIVLGAKVNENGEPSYPYIIV